MVVLMKKKVLTSIFVAALAIACVVPAFAASLPATVPSADMNDYNTSSYNEVDYDPSDGVVLDNAEGGIELASDNAGVALAANDDEISGYEEIEATVTPIDETHFQISTPDGVPLAVYNTDSNASSRATWRVNWAVVAGGRTADTARINSYAGLRFYLNITGSPSGPSKIGIAIHNSQTFYWIRDTANGIFGGDFTIAQNLGPISLAIKNTSNHTMTYTGTFSI